MAADATAYASRTRRRRRGRPAMRPATRPSPSLPNLDRQGSVTIDGRDPPARGSAPDLLRWSESEAPVDLSERRADRRGQALARRSFEQELRVGDVDEPFAIEGTQSSQRFTDRERRVRDAARVAGDAKLELRRAVTVPADEDRDDLVAVEHTGRMRVGGDVLGAAARAAMDRHAFIVSPYASPSPTDVPATWRARSQARRSSAGIGRATRKPCTSSHDAAATASHVARSSTPSATTVN